MDDPNLSIAHRWVKGWSEKDEATWLSLFAPNGEYVDHAFMIRRIGHNALKRHFTIWITSIPDFIMEMDGIERTSYGCAIRFTGRGTLEKDLPSRKASGKAFVMQGSVHFQISGEGEDARIEQLNEYYTRNFDDGKGIEQYHTLNLP